MILGVSVLMFLILILNILFNFRSYGINSIDNKAKILSQTIKHALTSQMVNGVIKDRKLFLSQIENLEHVDKIWLVRGQKVIKQFGSGFTNEIARDDVDKKVLNTGESIQIISENIFSKSTYRITIPYKATKEGPINCLSCHNASEGDTLGAISIELSADKAKSMGMQTVVNTVIISLLILVMILVFIHKIISPFLSIFESIKHVMGKAQEGDYSTRIAYTKSEENNDVARWINTLLEKLQITLADIDTNINVFLEKDKNEDKDPLLKVKASVSRLSEIYKFRTTIEQDRSLEQIYIRLATIIDNKFHLNNFSFYESSVNTGEIKLVYSKNKTRCNAVEHGCRANRTNTVIDSCSFNELCSGYDKTDGKTDDYLCIPYSISNELDLIISIISDSKEQSLTIRNNFELIKDYIVAIRTEIISKKLMNTLEKSANTDPLTGLYNRKYLVESINKINSQASRVKLDFGVLMVDIDFFKKVNDTYGHDVGDNAIKILADSLRETTRNSDILVRFGGEEFIILLYDCKEETISEVAEKIRLNFMSKIIPAGYETISKTISIGSSTFPNDSKDLDDCIKFADLALYNAKNTGRNKVVKYIKDFSKKTPT